MSLQMKGINFFLKHTIKPILSVVPFHERMVWMVRDTVNVMTHIALRPKAEYHTVNIGDGLTGEWIDYTNPKSPTVGRVVLYLHGGAYLTGSPSTHRTVTSAISKYAKCSVFALDYRKAPEHKYPQQLNDAVKAYMWLYSLGYRKISIAGDSAGGNLTLVTTKKLIDLGFPIPASICCISPWCKMWGFDQYKEEYDIDPMLPGERISEAGGLYAGDVSLHEPNISPINMEFSKFPPTLFTVGELEVLEDSIKNTFKKIENESKNDKKYIKYEGCPHVFQLFYGFVPEARESIKDISSFFTKHWI